MNEICEEIKTIKTIPERIDPEETFHCTSGSGRENTELQDSQRIKRKK